MSQPGPKRTFRLMVIVLAATTVCIMAVIGAVVFLNRPLTAAEVAATLAALPSPTPLATLTPTPVPTLPGVTEGLLVCQRRAGEAMSDRQMVGAVNLSDDHLLLFKWASIGERVASLDDALAGVILAFDVALDVWEDGCAVFDRVRVEAYDRMGEQQIHRLTAEAAMDDILQWHAGGLSDTELIARIRVTLVEP